MDPLLAELRALRAEVHALAERVTTTPAELLTPKAAAEAMSICTWTLREIIKKGQIRKTLVGDNERDYRIAMSEVRAYIARRTKGAAAPKSKRRAAEPYDARAEYEKTMRRLGGRRG